MARTDGRHRVTRRTKIATGLIGLALAASGVAVATTAGEPGNASADPVDKAFFVDITTVAPNVKTPPNQRGASTGTFTVDCGENQNGHFNPDNFIAQPGIKNGAQHLHDYVGNLTTNADSTNESLAAGGTTCKNGDQSAYFWPVIRIDRADGGASATTTTAASGSATGGQSTSAPTTTSQAATPPQVDCPDVVSQLPTVPDQAMAEVTADVDQLDQQVTEANQTLATTQAAPDAAQKTVLGSLHDKRTAVINRILAAIGRFAPKPPLDTGGLGNCSVKHGRGKGGGGNGGGRGNGGGNGGATTTTTAVPGTTSSAAASTTTAADSTTTAADSTTSAADSTTSAAASTTDLPGATGANQAVGGNDGTIVEPESATITFRGNPTSKVTAMPQFLRVLTGDAKQSTNGPANARASWTCTGHENTILDKYPICPTGTKVERIHDFPSCWDGTNIDSANHRTHIVFPDANGRCQTGFKAVPQLRVTLVYDIPLDVQQNGQYKVDAFEQEHHNPLSDHDDFANVMSQRIMWRLVNCVNTGRICNE